MLEFDVQIDVTNGGGGDAVVAIEDGGLAFFFVSSLFDFLWAVFFISDFYIRSPISLFRRLRSLQMSFGP